MAALTLVEHVLRGLNSPTRRRSQRTVPVSAPAGAWAHATDAELAQALQVGDSVAQREVWRRFLPVVRGMARRRLGGGADVEDIVQEAFLALFGSIGLLREAVALRAFSLTITARILNREVQRRSRASAMTTVADVAAEGLARDEPEPAARHAYAALRALVSRLRKRERRVFTLRFVAGMSAPEVASSLGVSIPTVRRVLSTAQKRIFVWASRDPFLSDYLERDAAALGNEDPPNDSPLG